MEVKLESWLSNKAFVLVVILLFHFDFEIRQDTDIGQKLYFFLKEN
jgi:hypothetical protein